MFLCEVQPTVILNSKQAPNAACRQKQLSYYDRCRSSSGRPKGTGHLEAGRPQHCSEPGPEGCWCPASGDRPPAGPDLFNPPLFLISLFSSCLSSWCWCKVLSSHVSVKVWQASLFSLRKWVARHFCAGCRLALSWIQNVKLCVQKRRKIFNIDMSIFFANLRPPLSA